MILLNDNVVNVFGATPENVQSIGSILVRAEVYSSLSRASDSETHFKAVYYHWAYTMYKKYDDKWMAEAKKVLSSCLEVIEINNIERRLIDGDPKGVPVGFWGANEIDEDNKKGGY